MSSVQKRIKFSHDEDQKLIKLVESYGQKNWGLIANEMPGRSQRQCRERWLNNLSPFFVKNVFKKHK